MKEKLEILNQLENKEITAQEAEERLATLRAKQAPKPAVKNGKSLKIFIQSNDGDVVNVQVPMLFARTFLKGSKHFGKKVDLEGLDVDIEAVLDLVDSGEIGELVNIKSSDGDTVRVVIE